MAASPASGWRANIVLYAALAANVGIAVAKFDSFRFGAGIGARYYTSFGPIRIDLATPLDPRKGDPKVGVYVSIGQAF